jgi:hypothetical protein
MKLWCSFLFPSSVFYDCKGCEAIGLGEKPFLCHFRYMEDQIDVQFILRKLDCYFIILLLLFINYYY